MWNLFSALGLFDSTLVLWFFSEQFTIVCALVPCGRMDRSGLYDLHVRAFIELTNNYSQERVLGALVTNLDDCLSVDRSDAC